MPNGFQAASSCMRCIAVNAMHYFPPPKTFQAAHHYQGSLKIILRLLAFASFRSGRSRFYLLQRRFVAVAVVLHAHRAGGNNGRNRVFVHHLRNRCVA